MREPSKFVKDDWAYEEDYTYACKKCKKQFRFKTQTDDNPEYYTDIAILCDCGEWLPCVFPVN